MKQYKIKVSLHGVVTWDIVPSYNDDYNAFNTLAEAKQFALDNMPSMHPSDVSYWRERIRQTTLEEVFNGHWDSVEIGDKLLAEYEEIRNKEAIEKEIAKYQEEIDSYTTDGSGGQSAMYNDGYTQDDTWLTALKWVMGMSREEICEEQNKRSTEILGY